MTDRKIHPLVAELAGKLPSPQADAAERAGITQAYLSQIVRGVRQPTLETIDKLAGVAGLEVRLGKRRKK